MPFSCRFVSHLTVSTLSKSYTPAVRSTGYPDRAPARPLRQARRAGFQRRARRRSAARCRCGSSSRTSRAQAWRTQHELARALHIEGPTLTRHIDGLEEDGLVVRRRDASDRRAVSVELTDAGRAKHAELLRAVQAFNRRLLAGFSAEEIDELRALLAKLEQNARTQCHRRPARLKRVRPPRARGTERLPHRAQLPRRQRSARDRGAATARARLCGCSLGVDGGRRAERARYVHGDRVSCRRTSIRGGWIRRCRRQPSLHP